MLWPNACLTMSTKSSGGSGLLSKLKSKFAGRPEDDLKDSGQQTPISRSGVSTPSGHNSAGSDETKGFTGRLSKLDDDLASSGPLSTSISSSTTSGDSAPQYTRADLLKPLPPLKDVSSSQKETILIQKLRLCSVRSSIQLPTFIKYNLLRPLVLSTHFTRNALQVIFDFSIELGSGPQAQAEIKGREAKRVYLLDVTDYFERNRASFSERATVELLSMIAANLFRTLPPKLQSDSKGGGEDDDEVLFDPAWPHIGIVYELFNKFIVSSEIDVKVRSSRAHACALSHSHVFSLFADRS